MRFAKSGALVILKTLVVLFIPYSWYIRTDQTSPTQVYTTNTLAGTWGAWSPGVGYVPYFNYEPSPIWEQSQILFSLLLILPLITFALFFGKRALDRTCIMAAAVSVFLSLIVTYLLTLNFYFDPFYLVMPKVVSLATFVFVFWPLLRSSWPSLHSADELQQKQGGSSGLRGILNEIVPINTSILVWIILVIFPAVSNVYISFIPGTFLQYDFSTSGGLSAVTYYYAWINGVGQVYPSILTDLHFSTASAASPTGLLFWTLNLWLGVTTLRYVLGKSTIRTVRILATIIVLINAIPAASVLMMGMGLYIIPLPFFPIAMLLVAKFTHAPDSAIPITEDMIRVPLRTRISSIFQRKDELHEVAEAADTDDQTPKTDEE
ncbi:MAG: hypothetical protein C4K48_11875 [Candidatus Thorarchaeota archaeon]|nr:MAG: hypothetical protein C4K48_11875 [Candidatus Thorarchaeota archaeon]